MANFRKWGALLLCAVLLAGCAAQPTATPTPTESPTPTATPQPTTEATAETVTPGTVEDRGFVHDNVLRSAANGDIHFSSYIPADYDGNRPYALFVSLPGWEGLYFQGVGENLHWEEFAFAAQNYVPDMIIISPQLNDWGETSAEQTIALTEYFLQTYNIDPARVYLEGYSGGGEAGSIVMGLHPDLYTAYLALATQWDGDLNVLADAETPVYMGVGDNDSYYGSGPLRQAYAELCEIYKLRGKTQEEIDRLVVLDVRGQQFFTEYGFTDQHAGGGAFAHDETTMGWLFGLHEKGTSQ